MKLSEAKEIVKDFNEKNRFRDCGKLNSAIDTVLKALREDELIIDRVKNIKDRLAYDITYNWDNVLDDLRRLLGV